jgi:hypothetical protein
VLKRPPWELFQLVMGPACVAKVATASPAALVIRNRMIRVTMAGWLPAYGGPACYIPCLEEFPHAVGHPVTGDRISM